jgi:16S rRNA processing protein RimM
MSKDSRKILVGKIVAPQGLRGEVRVQTYTGLASDFRDLEIKNLKMRFVRAAGRGAIIAKVDGIDDRTSAESLRGTGLFIERSSLPPLPPGEYYQADLIGMRVSLNGLIAGKVDTVHNFGAGDILELESGEMISFQGADVDMESKIIYIS